MRVTLFSTKACDRQSFIEANHQHGHQLKFLDVPLNANTVVLAKGADAVCVFVNDKVSNPVLRQLSDMGVKLIALRCVGYQNIDMAVAAELGLKIVRVPAYSPHAVAEHTLALILTLTRKTHRAFNRVREGNFSLTGLLGFDLHGKTVGLIGLGNIGLATARILKGFGCRVLGHDICNTAEAQEIGVEYTSLDTLYAQSDIISLHCPLTPQTFHLINDASIAQMKDGIMLINTSRGAILDTQAVTRALKSEKIRSLGIDVYEGEGDIFYEDLPGKVLQEDVFMRLLSFPNVLITGHQAFYTQEALLHIAQVTLKNVSSFEQGLPLKNEVFSRAHATAPPAR